MPVKSTRNLQFEAALRGPSARAKALETLQVLARGDAKVALTLLAESHKTVFTRNQMLNFKPNPKQEEFYLLGTRKKRRAFFGGNRTGKTTCGAAEVAYHATGMYPQDWKGHRFYSPPLIWASGTSLSKTVEGVQKMLLGPQDNMGTGFIPGHRIAETKAHQNSDGIKVAYIRWGESGNKLATIFFKSYEQGRKAFETEKVDVIWLDEEPPMDVYHECTMRLLGTDGKPGGIMLLTFTPLLGMSDVCRVFLRPVDPDDEEAISNGIVVASWADNTHLNEEEVEELRRSTPDHEREAREFGRPIMGSGMIFPISEKIYAVDFFEIPVNAGWKFAIGLDHGWDHPAALCFYAQDPNTGDCYLYRTWRGTKCLIPVMTQIIKDEFARIGGQCPVYADPSGTAERQDNGGKSIFQQYADCGVYLVEADNQVESGLIEMFTALQSARLKVFKGAPCIHFWEEVRVYHKKNTREGKSVIVKKDDDTMDAARYPMRHRNSWMVPHSMSAHRRKNRRAPSGSSWKVRR